MPPKKKQEPSKKTQDKKKEKIVEDKTFGLKNKKGKKQQQFIKQVANQVKHGGTSIQKRESADFVAKQKKVEEKKEKSEMETLFRPVAQPQKLSAGADPKSVLCLFHKLGQCRKGDKCKFSHDLSLEGKSEKRSMYVDSREMEEDTIDKWDENKLREVVTQKHGDKTKPKTDIVCKHFLHAIEKGIYGWFWDCPSGDRCIYRHALPPGFVFKQPKQEQEEEETITIEELVEKEREQLAASGNPLTKVTLETFLAWKKRKLKEKEEKQEMEFAKRKEAFKAGRTHGISGRELFEFNPDLVEGDDLDATDDVVFMREKGEEEEEEGVDVVEALKMTGSEAMALPLVPPRQLAEGEGGEEGRGMEEGAVGGREMKDAAAGGREERGIEDSDTGLLDEQMDVAGDEEEEEEAVEVDESLFDVENLEDLVDLEIDDVPDETMD